jgi:hypothetical protein
MAAKNLFGKTKPKEAPYAVYKGYGPLGDTEVRVLKTYQTHEREKENPHARWFVVVKTDMTFGSYDMGDSYIMDAIRGLKLIEATDEWRAVYG